MIEQLSFIEVLVLKIRDFFLNLGSPESLPDLDKENRLKLPDKNGECHTIKVLANLAQLVEQGTRKV